MGTYRNNLDVSLEAHLVIHLEDLQLLIVDPLLVTCVSECERERVCVCA